MQVFAYTLAPNGGVFLSRPDLVGSSDQEILDATNNKLAEGRQLEIGAALTAAALELAALEPVGRA